MSRDLSHIIADTLVRASVYKFAHAVSLPVLILIALAVWFAVYRRF